MTRSMSRRAFLGRAAALSGAGVGMPWALGLSAMGEAAAANATDYKALVCVFLYGGNDCANTLPPMDDASHAAYRTLRGGLATAYDALVPTLLTPAQALPDGRRFALAPQLAALRPVFDAGRLAVQLNVGTLMEPTTKEAYTRGLVALPPKLFSHNDQQSVWQAQLPEGATSGWGGRMGDLFAAANGNATFTSVSVAGNAVYLSGRQTLQYQVSPAGSVAISALSTPLGGSVACSALLRELVTAPRSGWFENELARVSSRSIAADAQLRAATADVTLPAGLPADNPLAAQLAMVARMIAARDALGARRQVFFVSLGGFDTHAQLAEDHPPLLATVGAALAGFDTVLGRMGVADRVTAFTASDFGRTLTVNDSGSDHGWGSHHFVLGGAVRGRAFYGRAPVFANDGPDDVGQGRLLPSTSVDQYAATLGRWFGVSDTELLDILPTLGRYTVRDLGFMG